jgi:hypothetical protein
VADRTVRYIFSAAGQGSVLSAFRSIESAQQQHARQVGRSVSVVERGHRQEARYVNQTAKIAERVARDQERAQVRAARAAERTAKQRIVAEERAQKQITRAHERGIDQQRKANEKLTREKQRAMERHAKALARTDQQNERERQRGVRRAIQAQQREEKRAERDRQKAWARRDAVAGSMASGAIGAVARGGAMLAAAGVGLGGAALRGAFATDDIARQIATSSRAPGETVDVGAIRKRLEAVAIATPGLSGADVGTGLQTFVSKTGRRDVGEAMLGDFATVASATGARMDEVASAAAAMFEKFDIKTVEGMRDAFATLTFQGKQGSFELKDAASQYDRLTAAAGKLGIGKGAGAVATLGGLTQIARGGTGSAEQAATSVEAMFRQLTAQSTTLKRSGVKVFDDKGMARNIQDVLVETISKVGGTDIEKKKVKLQEIFGEEGSRGVIAELTKVYSESMASGADGVQALRDRLDRAIKTTARFSDVQADATINQRSVGNTLTGVWERLKASVGDKLIPIVSQWGASIAKWAEGGGLESFASAVASAASALGKLASVVAPVVDWAAKGVSTAVDLGSTIVGAVTGSHGEDVQRAKAADEAQAHQDAVMRNPAATLWGMTSSQYDDWQSRVNAGEQARDAVLRAGGGARAAARAYQSAQDNWSRADTRTSDEIAMDESRGAGAGVGFYSSFDRAQSRAAAARAAGDKAAAGGDEGPGADKFAAGVEGAGTSFAAAVEGAAANIREAGASLKRSDIGVGG